MVSTRGMTKAAKSVSKPQAGPGRVSKAASGKSVKLKSTTRAVAPRKSITPQQQQADHSEWGTTSASSQHSVKPYSVKGNPPPRPRPRRSFSAFASPLEQLSPTSNVRRAQLKAPMVPTDVGSDDEARVSAKPNCASHPLPPPQPDLLYARKQSWRQQWSSRAACPL
jgi:hypothetical protein